MPVTSIQPVLRGSVIERPKVEVYTKDSWSDADWTLDTTLRVNNARKTVQGWPSGIIGSAQLVNWVGRIKETNGTRVNRDARDLLNKWIRITLVHNRSDPDDQDEPISENIWWGQVIADSLEQDRNDLLSGRQTITAYSVDHLLGRRTVKQARDDQNLVVQKVPAFNRRAAIAVAGLNTAGGLLGNRSNIIQQNQDYFFGTDDNVWNAYQALQRIVLDNAPEGVTWTIAGQTDDLAKIKDHWDLDRMTLKKAFDILIPRNRGFGWYVSIDDSDSSDEKAVINVFTTNQSEVTIGTITITANPNTETFDIPHVHPLTHIVDPIPIHYDNNEKFDRIRVRTHKPIKVVASFSFADDTLDEGWDAQAETNYQAETTKDALASDRYKDVYTRYLVRNDVDGSAWNGWVSDGEAGLPDAPCSFFSDTNGTVSELLNDPALYLGNKKFLPILPFVGGLRYDLVRQAGNVQSELDADATPEYLKPFAVIKDDDDTRWAFVNKLHEKTQKKRSASVGLLEEQLGLRIQWTPQHYCDKDDAATLLVKNFDQPVLDYKDIVITGFFETDQYQEVVTELPVADRSGNNKELIVHVRDAEYWRAMPGTVIGVASDGSLQRIHASNLVLRDDIEKLEVRSAALKEFYQRSTNAVSIRIHYLSALPPTTATQLGTIITAVQAANTSLARTSVNSVVTMISWDFLAGTTTTRTDFLRPERV